MVNLTVLKQHQYCVVLDPVGFDGRSHLGMKEIRVGPRTFFLQPGMYERLFLPWQCNGKDLYTLK